MPDELNRILKQSRKVEFQSGATVFHQVKIFNKNGKLIKVIPAKKLKALHWHTFTKNEKKIKHISIQKGRKKDESPREVQGSSTTKQLKAKKL